MRFRPRLPQDTATLLLVTVFIIVLVGLSLASHDPASHHVQGDLDRRRGRLLAVYLAWVVPYLRADAAARASEPTPSTRARSSRSRVSAACSPSAGVGAAFVSDWFVAALAPAIDQLASPRPSRAS